MFDGFGLGLLGLGGFRPAAGPVGRFGIFLISKFGVWGLELEKRTWKELHLRIPLPHSR